jgi:hypothetical protein
MPQRATTRRGQRHENVSRRLIVPAYADTMQRIAADGSR